MNEYMHFWFCADVNLVGRESLLSLAVVNNIHIMLFNDIHILFNDIHYVAIYSIVRCQ